MISIIDLFLPSLYFIIPSSVSKIDECMSLLKRKVPSQENNLSFVMYFSPIWFPGISLEAILREFKHDLMSCLVAYINSQSVDIATQTFSCLQTSSNQFSSHLSSVDLTLIHKEFSRRGLRCLEYTLLAIRTIGR